MNWLKVPTKKRENFGWKQEEKMIPFKERKIKNEKRKKTCIHFQTNTSIPDWGSVCQGHRLEGESGLDKSLEKKKKNNEVKKMQKKYCGKGQI